MEEWMWYVIAFLICLPIAWKMISDKEKGKTDTAAVVPVYGVFFWTDLWWPKTNRQKNVIIGKFMMAVFMVLSMTTTWFFVMLAGIVMLVHIEYFSEDGS